MSDTAEPLGRPGVLPRHELRRGDGRRLYVYGPLRGSLPVPDIARSDGAAAIHKRLDILTDSWIAVSPARNTRPLDQPSGRRDAECPFCPGGFEVPFPYDAAVFDNRFPPLRPDPPPPPELDGPTSPALGRAEIVLYTARHEASFASLTPAELGRVLAVWIDRSGALWEEPAHAYVAVFENRGAPVGATIAHPHGQIYALDHLPPLVAARAAAHLRARSGGACLSCAVARRDASSTRVIFQNESFLVAVPFAPRWPYEISIRALRHGLGRLADLEPVEQLDLIRALSDVTRRYDALFGVPLPYMMVVKEAPRDQPDWHLAFDFYPPNRGAETVKIRASSETGLGFYLNDVAPEEAASRLVDLEVAPSRVTVSDIVVVQVGASPAAARLPEAASEHG